MNFIGHQKIINLLDRSIEKGKIAQAYLFSGPESVGKFALAKLFANSLISSTNITLLYSNVANVGKAGSGSLIDLMIVEPEREEKKGVIKEKDISIEQVREAQKFLLTFPSRGKYKILIINNAHRMTASAQNSLLKILEEPNSTSIIILITHKPEKILSTLKSRCQKINFSLVDDEKIKTGLRISGEIAKFSLGRPGLAVKLAENKEMADSWRNFAEKLEKFSSLGINECLSLAEKLSKNIPETVKKLEIWIWLIRNEALNNSEISARENFKKIALIEKSVSEMTETNASGRLTLENLLMNL